MPNRLAGETSPYLLQHAGNPVDWYPWGDEALSRARAEDKPVLLSIGYSACHWCHVMAHECFENDEIACLMNQSFINIKVDREERPDLDSIYMESVQAMTGGGGWPLTVFLTPEGKPFFGGTYFPPLDKQGMPGFPRVLEAVAGAYRSRRSDIEQTASELSTALSQKVDGTVVDGLLTADILGQAYLNLKKNFDTENGGFGRAPKFPQPAALEFLLRYYHRSQDVTALESVDLTLKKMSSGGIHDQIGGGFHRYATDEHWLVPHFEKMLYDNAQLSHLYLHAYLVTGKPWYRRITEQTLDYVLREMTAPAGGFYSTQDADSEGAEGKYYLWAEPEIADVLGEDTAGIVNSYYGVTPDGNFEGSNILHVATDNKIDLSVLEQARASLLKRRATRVKPGRDEKILASWNGLMLASLAEAACVLSRKDYLTAAVANGSFLLGSMIVDGKLMHSYKDGTAKIDGYLQDYAMVIQAFLVLHQVTLQVDWLNQAVRLAESMVEQFWDESRKILYDTGKGHGDLFVRPRNIFDEAVPSGSSVAASVLLKLARITDNRLFQQVAAYSLQTAAELMRQYPLGLSNWLCALDFYLSPPEEIVIVGHKDDVNTLELLHTICTTWAPDKVVVAHDPDDSASLSQFKLLEGKGMLGNQPTVYVCQSHTCQKPVTDAVSLKAQLQQPVTLSDG